MTVQLNYSPDDLGRLCRSIRNFGFGEIRDALTSSLLSALQAEAEERFCAARQAQQSADPPYRARIVALGPKATDFFCSRETMTLLRAVFGRNFLLSAQRSTLTYYAEGDHLGPHLDKPEAECKVTLLTYLVVRRSSTVRLETGLTLRVYGQTMPDDGQPTVSFETRSGTIVVGHGSKFWHERPRLERDEYVIGLTGCYTEEPGR